MQKTYTLLVCLSFVTFNTFTSQRPTQQDIITLQEFFSNLHQGLKELPKTEVSSPMHYRAELYAKKALQETTRIKNNMTQANTLQLSSAATSIQS
ncbi:MAG: hypothetical protein WC747_00415 [Candidatus Babeliales bacterium]|jgi:hypothetical protein